jgi:hypothetical protein
LGAFDPHLFNKKLSCLHFIELLYLFLFSIVDEWDNFLERVECKSEEELLARDDPELKEELCLWASYRGQTLTRTGNFSALKFYCF